MNQPSLKASIRRRMLGSLAVGLALLNSLFLTGCLDAFSVGQLRTKQTELKNQIEVLTRSGESIQREKEGLGIGGEEALKTKQSVDELTADKSSSLRAISGLEVQLRERSAILQAYRNSFEPKYPIPVGQVFETLSLKNGSVLRNAKLVEMRGRELKFSHSTGIAFSDISGLPDELQSGWRVPPSGDSRVINPDAIFASKPKAAMTDDQVRDLASREREDQRKQEEMDREEKRKRRVEIDVQIARHERELMSLNSQKADMKNKWAFAKIKPSSVDQAEIIGKLDKEISRLQVIVSGLREEKSLIGY